MPKKTIAILLISFMGSLSLFANGASEAEADAQVCKIYHHMGEQGKRDGLQAWIDAVQAEYPDYRYEVQAINADQYASMLKTKIASGDTPDVIFGRPARYKEIVDAGHVMDISGEGFVQNVNPSAMDSMRIDGKAYGVPIDLQTMGIYINEDLFAQHGLSAPATFSELIAAADTFAAKDVVPFAHGFKEGWVITVDFQSDFYGAVPSRDKNFYSDIMNKKRLFADSERFKKSLERFVKRISYSSGDDFGTDNSRAVQMFAAGKAAMLIQGSWSVSGIRNLNPEGNFSYIINPQSDDPSENILNISVDDAFMISSQTTHMDEIRALFDYATSPEGAKVWTEKTGTVSFVKGAPKDNLDPMAQDMAALLAEAETFNFESIDIFYGQYDSVFRKSIMEFAAAPDHDVAAFIRRLDREFLLID